MGRFRSLLSRNESARLNDTRATGQELQQALLLLRDYESSGLGWFWSSDPEGRITYISSCITERMQKKREEVLGQPVQSLFVLQRDEYDHI